MRKILVLQHVAYEPLGILDPLLREAGFRIRYVNFGREPHAKPHLDGYAGLVVLGGPMGVNDVAQFPHLTTELRLIERALDRDLPLLGICLGAQLLASALGATVRRNESPEIGWYELRLTDAGREDEMLGHFGHSESIFQWHGDTFDVPADAVHLAHSERCAAQAFRYGTKAYGLQFHLEADAPLIERWLGVPTLVDELHSVGGPRATDEIRERTGALIERSEGLGRRAFRRFTRIAGWRGRRRRALHSR